MCNECLVTQQRFDSAGSYWVCSISRRGDGNYHPSKTMNNKQSIEQIQLDLDLQLKDIKSIGQKWYPHFGLGRIISTSGNIHFTTQSPKEGEE